MLVKRIAACTHLQPFRSYSKILVGNCNFSYPLAFNAPVGGVPIGIPGKSLVLRKLESWSYQAARQFNDRLSRFDTIPACDGQTDRQTDRRPAYIKNVRSMTNARLKKTKMQSIQGAAK